MVEIISFEKVVLPIFRNWRMTSNIQKTEKIAALCGIIWFITIIDACFTWFFPWIVRYMIGTPLVIYATVLLRQKNALIVSGQRRKLFMLFFCLLLIVIIGHLSLFSFIKFPLLYIPIFCLVFWPRTVLVRFYVYLRRFVVFYAIVSIFVEILVLSGIWSKLPCLIFPPYDNVQKNHDIINRFYGLFVIPEPTYGVTFYRAMGPLREGGHFSVFLGFIYFIEKAVHDKRNIWIIIAGLLTLSPNFVFYFLMAEGYVAVTRKRIKKAIIGLVCFVILIVGAVWFSPGFIKDEIIRIVLERSLEENLENAGTGGYMELLDGRTNIEGMQMWNHFVKRADFFSTLTGANSSDFEEQFVLSDFRFLIFRYGYLGFFFILICTIAISFWEKKNIYGICVLLLGLWVMVSRAWMFNQLYIWIMMLLAVNMKMIQESNSRFSCSIVKSRLIG